ncbi:Cysteine desulfurase [Chitinispirillum alkaliphilum]|nr:Cysteine desulfurase [Chitinispirillum alkaliphilum]
MVHRHIETAREQVAALLGASPEEIIFTSCGSESNNMALKGFTNSSKYGKCSIVTSAVEHPSVRNTARYLKATGCSLTELSVDSEGMIHPEIIDDYSVGSDTLVSLMWGNNETGVLFPIEQIAHRVKARGGFFHTDAVQAVGKVPVDLSKVPVDMLSLSGHKVHAPKGVGALYVRKGFKVPPLLHGGHQEGGLRAGTENVAYIVGLGKACELAIAHMEEENSRVKKLRDRLEAALLSKCQNAKLNGNREMRLPNTTNVSFEAIEGEAILLHLDETGIAASSGSACTTGSLEPSHVMIAMGIPYTFAHSSTRFSLSRYTTDEEIDAVINAMPAIVDKLRKLSPFAE